VSQTYSLARCPPEIHALGVLIAGLTSAGTLTLYAKGYRQEAVAITVSAAVLGAFVGAARLLEDKTSAEGTP
jgi:hypothetical protein